MKKFLLCIGLFLVPMAIAEGSNTYDNNLELEVAPIFVANINLNYERSISELFSLSGGIDIGPVGSLAMAIGGGTTEPHSDYGAYVGFSLYPVKPMESLFIQLYGAYYRTHFKVNTFDGENIPDENTLIAPGIMIGWKWRVADRASIRLGGGSGYDSNRDDVKARISATLGVMF